MNSGLTALGIDEGFNSAGRWGGQLHQQWLQQARIAESNLSKAFTTGASIVNAGDTGGATIRTQWLPGLVERASFQSEDAIAFKRMPKKKAYSTTIEQTFATLYGSVGSGFMPELGEDTFNGVTAAEDSFIRTVQYVAFMAVERNLSFVAETVPNQMEDPAKLLEDLGELELLGKANAACYFADRGMDVASFNGYAAQIRDWIIAHPERQACDFDCNNQPLSEEVLRDAQKRNRRNWGRWSVILSSVDVKGDLQKMLYPKERFDGSGGVNSYGVNPDQFKGAWAVDLVDDPMIINGQPMAVDGPRADPSIPTVADAGAPVLGASPFTTCADAAPGAGFWRQNHNRTQDTGALTTVPALPPNSSASGQSGNHLAAGTYNYAITAVYGGRESLAWVFGAAGTNTVAGATTVTVTAGHVVKIEVDLTTPAVTGLGSTFPRQRVWYRVYRAPSGSALSGFQFLMNIGAPATGNAWGYDNGVIIPGTEKAFGITERKNGKDMWAWLNLLPMAKRMLPNTLTTDPFGLLLFGTPFLPVPHMHTVFRNIGPSPN